MRRHRAARERSVGLEVLTLTGLAERLAGGFFKIADDASLADAVTDALRLGGLGDLDPVAMLPGTPRAVLTTLKRAWSADVDISARIGDRFSALTQIERRVAASLAPGQILPRDLRDRALLNVSFAPKLVGPAVLERVADVPPLWRPLLVALADHVDMTWQLPPAHDPRAFWWFPGSVVFEEKEPAPVIAEVCSDPRAEVVEALRWARALIVSGAHAGDVGIASASTEAWDQHIEVLGRPNLPLYFPHGLHALSTPQGQACAALADILMRGINQDRLRRLVRLSPLLSTMLGPDWKHGLPPEAELTDLDQWRDLASSMAPTASRALLTVLEMLSRGTDGAREAGESILDRMSLELWRVALRSAPAAAISTTLAALRTVDERDPANCVVWCSAAQLAAAPRKHMRLLGLAARSWPRERLHDPVLPHHVLAEHLLFPSTRPERDETDFQTLLRSTDETVMLSRARRSAEGTHLTASRLWPQAAGVSRFPFAPTSHAYSESDRLLARPQDAAVHSQIASAVSGWNDWRHAGLTAHDGLVRPDHPAIRVALAETQSASSVKRLVRDPLGFLFKPVLGATAPRWTGSTLQLDPAAFGDLVHQILARTVEALENGPGLVAADKDVTLSAVEEAAAQVRRDWPRARPTPPGTLWNATVAEAARRSYRGLTVDDGFRPDTRSWTEAAFGGVEDTSGPWPRSSQVVIGQHRIRLGGRIDRLDVTAYADAVRITDYKSGRDPMRPTIALDEGREVQRVLYALAVRQLMPNTSKILARLVYLEPSSNPYTLKGEHLDAVSNVLVEALDCAVDNLLAGCAAPGPDASSRIGDTALMLPADLAAYLARKSEAFADAHGRLSSLWGRP